MRRIKIPPRTNWRSCIRECGLIYNKPEEYWCEDSFYELTSYQVDVLNNATNSLHKMCMEAVDHIIEKDRFFELGILENAADVIRLAWQRGDQPLYGRFDFAFDGVNPPKMMEYNADTPAVLIEASLAQLLWLEDVFDGQYDQFNSIHEKLIERWRELSDDNVMYFTCMEGVEDLATTVYLQDTAQQAGIETRLISLKNIGFQNLQGCFVDLEGNRINSLFKFYPWEWITGYDSFGPAVLETYGMMRWFEPIWKMILSNKGILPILWELFPDHENLLPSYFDGPREMVNFVRKPMFSREGANISIYYEGGDEFHTPGTYGEEGYVYQGLAEIPCFDRNYPMIGCWVIGSQSAGMGIREASTKVTDNLSRFVPHLLI